MAMPKILKNFNLYLDGANFIGKCDEVTLPNLQIITEDHRGGGMDAAARVDMGMETPELGFTMAEHAVAIYRQFGLRNQNAVQAVFRGALIDDTTATPYIVTARGMYTELDGGTVAVGGKNPLSGTISLRYYKLEVNGQTVIEIDVDNMKRIINGTDQLEEMRNILNG